MANPRQSNSRGGQNSGPSSFGKNVEQRKKYCRFKKSGIKYIDYKDPNFLLKFVNEQGKLLPRRLTGTSAKFQRKVAQAVKRARHIALLPYVADALK
ncbi:30S ribosomal protein S18 [Nostoc sp. NIES-2111]